MRGYSAIFSIALLLQFLAVPAESTTIRSVRLSDLFSEADVVAYVQVLAADSESYQDGLTKAKVTEAFKGCVVNQMLYFSPAEFENKDEYLVFLKDTGSGVRQNRKCGRGEQCPDLFPPDERVYTFMYEGFSVMQIGYSNALGPDWRDFTYLVAFAEGQIILPKEFKRAVIDAPWNRAKGHVLVSKATVAQYLRSLRLKQQ